MREVWVRNRFSTHLSLFMPIFEHSVIDTLKLTPELYLKKKKKNSGFKETEVSSLIIRLSKSVISYISLHAIKLLAQQHT